MNDKRIRESPSDVWKIVKESTGQSGKQPVKLKEDGKTLNYQESASGFNDFFLSKVETIKKSIDTSGTDPIKLAERRANKLGLKKNAFTLRTAAKKHILNIIKKSKKSSCPDIDGISPKMLKIASSVISEPLSWVINSLILSQTVPKVWKKARIITQEKFLAKNYRPLAFYLHAQKSWKKWFVFS
jgi:hypothetical protein